jgi:hypothetical protein
MGSSGSSVSRLSGGCTAKLSRNKGAKIEHTLVALHAEA